jgi:iron(III) transport system substrate-binding protein
MAAAKRLADWAATPKANALYNKSYAIVALPGVAKPIEHLPADLESRLIKNDFAWAAKNRERILTEWSRRYDSKSEPKS